MLMAKHDWKFIDNFCKNKSRTYQAFEVATCMHRETSVDPTVDMAEPLLVAFMHKLDQVEMNVAIRREQLGNLSSWCTDILRRNT